MRKNPGTSHYDALSLHENKEHNTTLYCDESKNPSLISTFSTGNKERLSAFPCLHLAPHNSNKIRPVFYTVSLSWGSAVVQYKILSQRGGYTQFRTQLYVTFMLRQNFRNWNSSLDRTVQRWQKPESLFSIYTLYVYEFHNLNFLSLCLCILGNH